MTPPFSLVQSHAHGYLHFDDQSLPKWNAWIAKKMSLQTRELGRARRICPPSNGGIRVPDRGRTPKDVTSGCRKLSEASSARRSHSAVLNFPASRILSGYSTRDFFETLICGRVVIFAESPRSLQSEQ